VTPEERLEIIGAASRVGRWLINLGAAGQGLSEQGRIVLSVTVEESSEPHREMSEKEYDPEREKIRQVCGGLPKSEGEGGEGSERAPDELAIPSFLVRHRAEPIKESGRDENNLKASVKAKKLDNDKDYLVEGRDAGHTFRPAAQRATTTSDSDDKVDLDDDVPY
jgi:hypothetical protein